MAAPGMRRDGKAVAVAAAAIKVHAPLQAVVRRAAHLLCQLLHVCGAYKACAKQAERHDGRGHADSDRYRNTIRAGTDAMALCVVSLVTC